MNSAPTDTTSSSSTSARFKVSKIPTPKGIILGKQNDNELQTMVPFEKRKSAEELKSRLASAVSAKIAAVNKDGTGRTTRNNNRGIGYLLQRKQQQDSKLNTKDISFQKPVRNGEFAKDARNEAINGSNLRGDLSVVNRAGSQKLLSALMSSRKPSGIPQSQSSQAVVGNRQERSTGAKPGASETKKTLVTGNKTSGVGEAPETSMKAEGVTSRKFPSSNKKPLVGIPKVSSSHSSGTKASASSREKNIVNSVNSNAGDKEKGLGNSYNLEAQQVADKIHLFEAEIHRTKEESLRTANRWNNSDSTSPNGTSTTKVIRKKGMIPKKQDAFREDLLETLEAGVGSCKIAAFQTMEDFSVLRMRLYRIRGDLEQLKREREKRTPI